MTVNLRHLLAPLAILIATTTQAASPSITIDDHFTRGDRNADGRLTADEMQGISWIQYDADGDGTVSKAEFTAGRTRDKREIETTADAARAWKLLDWNNDQYLSGFELDGKWEKFDADADGKVQQQEFLAARRGLAAIPAPDTKDNPARVVVQGGKPVAGFVPAGDYKSLWGQSLKTALAADLFQFFHLAPSGEPIALQAGTQRTYQPTAAAFKELVLVKLTISDDDKIVAAELILAGKFVRDPAQGVFARDIAKSFLLQLTPTGKLADIKDLHSELAYGAPGMVFADPAKAPKLPNPPTPGYQTYLGKKESHEQRIGDAKLLILAASGKGEDDWLTISFQPATEETN